MGIACKRSYIRWLFAIPGIWVQWLRGSFWIRSISVKTLRLLATAKHTVTLHYFINGLQWVVPYFLAWASSLLLSAWTHASVSFPSQLLFLFLLSSSSGQTPWKKTEKDLVSVLASLSHFLIFITRTGNVNFILHILTPLRKLYIQVKDRIWSKLTDDFWNQLCVCAWGTWCWQMQELGVEHQKAA